MKVAIAVAILSASLLGDVSGQEARPDPPVLAELSREFPKDDQLEARVLTATLQPGSTSPWHTHSAPVVVYVMEGTITLEFDGREPVSKKAGEALLEPINVKVRAANHGQTPARVVIFQVSPPKTPFLTPTK
jgi:quercetin dioxygenase-like cupin family protein